MGNRTLVLGKDGNGDDVARNTTGATEVSLLAHIHVRHVLILAEKRQMEDDLEGLSVGGEDNEIGDTSVEGLGGLVGTLLEELEVLGLVHDIEDSLLHGVVGKRVGTGHVLLVITTSGSGLLLLNELGGRHVSVGIRFRLDLLLLLFLFLFLILLIFLVDLVLLGLLVFLKRFLQKGNIVTIKLLSFCDMFFLRRVKAIVLLLTVAGLDYFLATILNQK